MERNKLLATLCLPRVFCQEESVVGMVGRAQSGGEKKLKLPFIPNQIKCAFVGVRGGTV